MLENIFLIFTIVQRVAVLKFLTYLIIIFISIIMVTRNQTTKNTWDSAPMTIYYVVGEKLKC